MDRTKIVACLSALLLVSCSGPPRIVVGSKNFTEQILLGEILAQQIERRMGVTVIRQLNLGGTLLAHEALVKGSIDLYPEYTGTALNTVLKQSSFPDGAAVLGAVRKFYQEKYRLAWLSPLGFNDTFAMIVRGETARTEHLTTLSEAAGKHSWHMGVGYEFKSRADGLDGLLKIYGLRLDGDPVTMDLGLLYSALQSRKVDMIAANSTDGLISALDVAILNDDKRYFPPYQCAVVVREETLARFPQLRDVLEQLAGKLPDATVRKLNYSIDGEHRQPAQVAGEFLNSALKER
ncbi:MAG TPA: glycine betaine ABC transporter substrate-binding protein [Bryobacteraceae bacterium]|jgi:glycine betaine/choline ABC-type transport system substrate-binding protein